MPDPALERFDRLAEEFADRLDMVRDLADPAFVRTDWAERNAELEAFLRPRPPRDFLGHPAIRYQMFVDERYVEPELPFVLDRLDDSGILAEDPVGEPPQITLPGHADVLTSSNTVHHVHHLLRYEQATGRPLRTADTIVEWGAGYGNLAKLMLRRHGGAPTLVLVDTPVFSALQWLYLGSVLGAGRVVLHERPAAVAEGAVNVVPIGLAGELEVDADLFVSTWALNESAPAAQELVLEREFFGAPSLLLAMHQGDPLEERVLERGAEPHWLGDFMPAQRYQLR